MTRLWSSFLIKEVGLWQYAYQVAIQRGGCGMWIPLHTKKFLFQSFCTKTLMEFFIMYGPQRKTLTGLNFSVTNSEFYFSFSRYRLQFRSDMRFSCSWRCQGRGWDIILITLYSFFPSTSQPIVPTSIYFYRIIITLYSFFPLIISRHCSNFYLFS